MAIPDKVQTMLRTASSQAKAARMTHGFSCNICQGPWDRFIETWMGASYAFILEALGPYGVEPLREIHAVGDGHHAAGANASYQPGVGQISLSPSVVLNKPGLTLEKITHELIHASLDGFPDGPNNDPFFEEGYVDYATWVVAHAPYWGEHRRAMIDAAAFNIKCRRDRAMRGLSEYDAKRWAGGVYCAQAYGPWIIAKLSFSKREGQLTWV